MILRDRGRPRKYAHADPVDRRRAAQRAYNKRRYADPTYRAKSIAEARQWAKDNPKRAAEQRRKSSMAYYYRHRDDPKWVEQYNARQRANYQKRKNAPR